MPHKTTPDWQTQSCPECGRLRSEAPGFVECAARHATKRDNTNDPTREERLEAALSMAVAVISDYLAYQHSGDPWEEDARAMGEMEINDYGTDGRLQQALDLLGVKP